MVEKVIEMHCKCCDQIKPLTRFSKRIQEGKRKYEMCNDCMADKQSENRKEYKDKINARRRELYPQKLLEVKDKVLKRLYGISLDSWNSILASQENRCAICKTTTPFGNGWHTDHDHDTGKVRGILCHCCNTMLGYAKDNQNHLLSGISYLVKHNKGNINENLSLEMGD